MRRSFLVDLYTQRSFAKNFLTYIFVEQFEEHLFAESLLVTASKTCEFKHMHHISKRDSTVFL